MCDFCHRHGEGKKWYLRAENYAEDMLSDLRRRGFMTSFFRHPEHTSADLAKLGNLDKAPDFIRRLITPVITRRSQKSHFGQVLPIEDIERIFEFVTSIVRVACYCRHITMGSEQRYCYGLSLGPGGGELSGLIREIDAGYLTGPETEGLEALTKEQTLAAFRDHEKSGLCHTVWTFITPFIGGICNCDRTDCVAMKVSLDHRVPVFFRAEYVAGVQPDLCSGCRECLRVCQFGAIKYSAARRKVEIDLLKCYGCGICRSVCSRKAISLAARHEVPGAARLWT